MRKNKKGFTLVEVIVVLVIIAILIAIAIPAIFKYIDDANDAKILVQARPVLLTSKAESAKMYADGTLDTLPYDVSMHKQIIEIADIDGELIDIDLNEQGNASGDFIVKIQDRYIYYNDKEETFEFIEDPKILSTYEAIKNALLEDAAKQIFIDYFSTRKTTNLDSEGPNYGADIKNELEALGIAKDNYSFRIYSSNSSNTITIGIPKITVDMVGQQVEVTRYDFGTSKDFTTEPKIYTATVTISKDETKDRNGKTVEYAVYKLDDANWVETK